MQTNVILAGLAAVLAIPTTISLISDNVSFTDLESVPRMFEGFTASNVQTVVLTRVPSDAEEALDPATPVAPGAEGQEMDVLVLRRQDDGWVISEAQGAPSEFAGVPVRANKVDDDVLEHAAAIRLDEQVLVAADADDETLVRRGLTRETGLLVSCRNAEGQPLAEFYLGKDASGGKYGEDVVKGFFVRREDRKDIVLYEPAQSYWNLTLKPEDWIETKIQQFQTDEVVAFSVRNPKGSSSFTRPKPDAAPAPVEGDELPVTMVRDWVADSAPEGVGAVRQSEVNGLLSRFGYVNVQRYVGHLGRLRDPQLQGRIPGPDQSTFEIRATLADGATYVMWVGEKIADKNEYYARFDGPNAETKNFLVAVGDWIVSGYEKDPKDLFDPAAPAPEEAKPEEGKTEEGTAEEGAAGKGEGEGGEPKKNETAPKAGPGGQPDPDK